MFTRRHRCRTPNTLPSARLLQLHTRLRSQLPSLHTTKALTCERCIRIGRFLPQETTSGATCLSRTSSRGSGRRASRRDHRLRSRLPLQCHRPLPGLPSAIRPPLPLGRSILLRSGRPDSSPPSPNQSASTRGVFYPQACYTRLDGTARGRCRLCAACAFAYRATQLAYRCSRSLCVSSSCGATSSDGAGCTLATSQVGLHPLPLALRPRPRLFYPPAIFI